MKQYILVCSVLLIVLLGACHSSPRSDQSFDQIRGIVQGKTASEIEELLGSPDSRQSLLLGDERWIWWNYTYLGGRDYPPEVQGKIVHLQITFPNPDIGGSSKPSYSEWRILDPQSVSFLLPGGGI